MGDLYKNPGEGPIDSEHQSAIKVLTRAQNEEGAQHVND